MSTAAAVHPESTLGAPAIDPVGRGASAGTIDAYGRRLSRKLELRGMRGRLSRKAGVGLLLEPAHSEAVDPGATP
jgi:hypothetical protein